MPHCSFSYGVVKRIPLRICVNLSFKITCNHKMVNDKESNNLKHFIKIAVGRVLLLPTKQYVCRYLTHARLKEVTVKSRGIFYYFSVRICC